MANIKRQKISIIVGIILIVIIGGLFWNLGKCQQKNAIRSENQTRVYFSPGNIQEQVIEAIDESNKTIDIAIYELTSSEIRKSLEAAKKREVKIRIVADKGQANDKNTLIPILIKNEFEVKLISGTEKGKNNGAMHHKFAIFDGKLLEIGSYNWTYSGENLNHENVLFITDPVVISEYQLEFLRLWGEN